MLPEDSDEKCLMHYESDNLEIMAGYDINEIIEELFDLLVERYQVGLEESINGSEFVFHYVDGLHNKYHMISFNRSELHISTP